MAGAFTFAEVLRDEYTYLHNATPRVRAVIEPKHLRELPRLILRIKRQQEKAASTASCEALLAKYCDFSADGGDCQQEFHTVEKAFEQLLRATDVTFAGQTGSLYEALLRIDDRNHVASARLRDPDILRKLLRIREARRFVFRDRKAAETIANDESLREVILRESAALRLIAHMEGGGEVLIAYPSLLATIADEPWLEERLAANEALRKTLIAHFSPARPGFWKRTARKVASIFVELTPERRPELWTLAGSPTEVAKLLPRDDEALPVPQHAVPEIELTNFNAIVLETSFPDHFTDSYDVRALNTAMHERDMAALCLSGGGIRSATFNLGILQGLADHGLLTRFHYLSTVSGGGYIGSWLSSWIRRHTDGMPGVAKDISAPPADPEEPELRPIQHLREHSSYLAPRSASLSADTWTLVATYFRNLLLNWTILLPALIALLTLPRLMESAAYAGGRATAAGALAIALGSIAIFGITFLRPKNEKKSGRAPSDKEIRRKYTVATLWVVPLVLSSAAFCIHWASLSVPPPLWELPRILATISALAGAAYILWHLYTTAPGGSFWRRIVGLFKQWRAWGKSLFEIAATAAAGFLAGLLLHFSFAKAFPPAALRAHHGDLYFEQFVCFGIPLFLLAFFAGATLLVGFTTRRTNDDDREWWARCAALMLLPGFIWMCGAIVTLGLPLLLAQLPLILASAGGISGAVSWLIARSSKLASKSERETTSGAALQLVLHVASALAAALVLAALSLATTAILFEMVQPRLTLQAVRKWELTRLAARHLAVLHATPPVKIALVLGAAAAIAGVMSFLLRVNIYSMHGMYRNRLIRAYLGASRWFRRPDPFTGFDPQDNLDMFELRADALWTSSYTDFDGFVAALTSADKTRIRKQLGGDVRRQIAAYRRRGKHRPSKDEVRSELTRALNELMATSDIRNAVPAPASPALFLENRRYLESEFPALIVPAPLNTPPREAVDGKKIVRSELIPRVEGEESIYLSVRDTAPCDRPPLHILNTALNLVRGENLAWQERKADSFTISPLHAGNRRIGYRDSFEYGEHISLGTALAISGAAVSPNMGFNSTPALTFLMTLFNARLGWWLGNPAKETYKEIGPESTLQSLMAELTGSTTDTSDYVFLSDGGHFDNLGLYEMVRRRCRYIIVSDATADGKYAFGDLGNAVRKIRIDMGIPITLHTAYLPPGPEDKAGRYCAVGRIDYGSVDTVPEERRLGVLLYIKPAVFTDCPPDIRNYKMQSETFPHETTVDQFFCESQFESYRALGRHVIGRICGDAVGTPAHPMPGFPEFLALASRYVKEEAARPMEVKLVEDFASVELRST